MKLVPCLTPSDEEQEGGELPQERDGHLNSQLEQAVDDLLRAYKESTADSAFASCVNILQRLPNASCEIDEVSWETLRARLQVALGEYAQSKVVASDAVSTASALWRTAFFPLVVVMEAWSRTTVFYLDAFYSLASSLINKEITFNVAGFDCRSRYWACGTAAPGAGKSPSLEPLKEAASARSLCHSLCAGKVPNKSLQGNSC